VLDLQAAGEEGGRVIYVEETARRVNGLDLCRMIADTHEELEAAARALAIKPEWRLDTGKPGERYEIRLSTRKQAFKLGARMVESEVMDKLIELRATDAGRVVELLQRVKAATDPDRPGGETEAFLRRVIASPADTCVVICRDIHHQHDLYRRLREMAPTLEGVSDISVLFRRDRRRIAIRRADNLPQFSIAEPWVAPGVVVTRELAAAVESMGRRAS
jgi:hypothetical protein